LAWNPAGDEIWFSESLGSGETTVSAVALSGERREVWRTAGRYEIQDIAADGTLLATFRDRQSGILALLPNAGEERDLSWLDGTVVADLSDDGRMLLFNEIGPGGGPNGSFYLRDLQSDAAAVRLGDGVAVDLSPDGKFALAYTPGVHGQYRIVPTGAGQISSIDVGDIDSVWAWFLPGREEILFNGREPEQPWRFYTIHPDGGAAQPVTAVGVDHYRGQKVVSPDGRWVAGITESAPYTAIGIFPLDGGESSQLPGVQARDVALRWSADSRSMYVFDRDILPTEIQRIDVETGKRTAVHTLMPTDSAGIRSIEQLALTSDGRYYAYSYTRDLDVLYTIEGLR